MAFFTKTHMFFNFERFLLVTFERLGILRYSKKQICSIAQSGPIMFCKVGRQRALAKICIFLQIFFKFLKILPL